MPLVPGVLITCSTTGTYPRPGTSTPRTSCASYAGGTAALCPLSPAPAPTRAGPRLFSQRRNEAPDPALIDEYLFECERLMAVVDLYEALLEHRPADASLIEGSPEDMAEPSPKRARVARRTVDTMPPSARK